MPTRREFLQQVAVLSSAAAWSGVFPAAIAKALAIDPEPGSTFLDAEHVVILMQENRSFDHTFGTLQGVRGFNDRRAITLPNGNPVWAQTNARGESYMPFRLNLKESNATWMGCLPHSRTDQVDARDGGRYDRWLAVKQSGNKQYAEMPLTMGYYTREDIPFYYALADAFTICDQHFCSALTSTTPNRLYLWTGTIRDRPTPNSRPRLFNEDTIYESEASYTTFPERLEEHGISWKVYQNELWLASGLAGEYDAWLTNFGDNPLEYFTQYQVRYAASHRRYLEQQARAIIGEIDAIRSKIRASLANENQTSSLKKELGEKTAALHQVERERGRWTPDNYEKLPARTKSIHARAFTTNADDPDYRQLATHAYYEGAIKREVRVPKGDVLHSFREDVRDGKLPTVSWLVAPERFSDHPGSAWYGAWYIAEALDILTSNPAVWKKTIFILTYDENDGYFDHVPPFVAPHPHDEKSGRVSQGIDTSVEFVQGEHELKYRPASQVRESPIGLGYRVPMIIASPWSRGGCICSQVFDHTSVLQFLERLLSHKTGRTIEEPNISQWRRTVCGDLTSAFQSFDGSKGDLPSALDRDSFIEGIHQAQFKKPPSGFKQLTQDEIAKIGRTDAVLHQQLPSQEPGVRRSAPLPYELVVDGRLNESRTRFTIRFEARNQRFGDRAAGSPFIVYARTKPGKIEVRNYAVVAGCQLEDSWPLSDFEDSEYHLQVYGPNGFYREFNGSKHDPHVDIQLIDELPSRDSETNREISLAVVNRDPRITCSVEIRDNAYGEASLHRSINPNSKAVISVGTKHGLGWYDLSARVVGNEAFERNCAGRVETGEWSYSDPAMGRLAVRN